MRIFALALIVVGVLGVAKYLGLIPIGMFHLVGPLLLIALGMALLFRRRHPCRGDWRGHRDGGSTSASQPGPAGPV